MSFLLAEFEPATTAASMAIGRPKAIGDAPAGLGPCRATAMGRPKGRSAAEDDGGETFLRREEWAEPGSPRDLSRGVESPGEESRSGAIAAQAI
ncbi:MAG: hypothetical protein ACLP4V_24330, partial [Methylocella sp.]